MPERLAGQGDRGHVPCERPGVDRRPGHEVAEETERRSIGAGGVARGPGRAPFPSRWATRRSTSSTAPSSSRRSRAARTRPTLGHGGRRAPGEERRRARPRPQAVGEVEPRARLQGRPSTTTSGLTPFLEALGFHTVGYGCTTCIGNSGPLPAEISEAVEQGDLVVCSVLSGNRNFEARIHPEVKANYLASPPLVVAYALAGRLDVDLTTEPIGQDQGQRRLPPRPLAEPTRQVKETIGRAISVEMYQRTYADVFTGDEHWAALDVPEGDIFAWDPDSTYVRKPPYFDGMSQEPGTVEDVDCRSWSATASRPITSRPRARSARTAGGGTCRPRRRAQGLQLVRVAARQPRGDGARHVRQRAPPQPGRAGQRRDVDGHLPTARR